MSTQNTTMTATAAEDFLKKYATIIGTLDAIKEQDREFLLKYATVVGTPAAVEVIAPEQPVEPTNIDDQQGDSVGEGDENIIEEE